MRRTRCQFYGSRFTPLALFAGGATGAWYDPSDLSRMFQDAAGTTPVTAAGQSVALIRDKSGNGHDLLQATAGNCPTLQVDGAGNRHLLFDGVGDILSSAATIDLGTQAQLGFGVALQPGATAAAVIAEFGVNSNTDPGGFGAFVNDPVAAVLEMSVNVAGSADIVHTGGGAGNGVTSVLTVQSIDITQGVAQAKLPMRRNGAAAALTTTSETAGAGATFGNKTLNLGARTGSAAPFGGKVYGLLIRGGAFSAAELASVETYLGAQCGVPL